MKPIKITAQNAAKIEDALKEVNGKATSFALTSFYDVFDISGMADDKLGHLPKKEKKGTEVFYTPCGPYASAYKYGAKSTSIKMERRATGWFLTDVKEVTVYPGQNAKLTIKVTDEQKEKITKNYLQSIGVAQ